MKSETHDNGSDVGRPAKRGFMAPLYSRGDED